MANEITINGSLRFAKGATDEMLEYIDQHVTVIGTLFAKKRQVVGTSIETIDIDDAVNGGFMIMINRDATNAVRWGHFASGALVGEMKPGEPAGPFRVYSANTLGLQAVNAPCEVEFLYITV